MQVENVIRLRDGEEVLAVLRNHWITRIGSAFLALLAVTAPFFFMVPLFSLGAWGAAVFATLAIFGVLHAARAYRLWYWNAFIVTDMRVVDIDQRGWFSRVVSEADYDRIQDVSFSVKGVRGAVFGFGSLLIQTAGASANLELPDVENPKDAHHLITEAMTARRGMTAPTVEEGRTRKVSRLLDAAAELDSAEARAFLTAIQQAVGKKVTKEAPDLAWFNEVEEGEDGDKSHLRH